jgi:hypothetical protein
MPSVQTDYRGRLTNRQHRERLARRIQLVGQAVHPALSATSRLVDTVLPWPVLVEVPGEKRFVEIGDVDVTGAELTLMDFRRDWHRFPFTFIREVGRGHLALPDLAGKLVTVEDREECRFYMSPVIQAAQCYLAPYGTQHLRYHLEPEFDLLMAYVRFFHMPELEYWRNGSMNRFIEYRKWATALREIPRGQRSVAAALESWRAATKWPARTESDPYDLRDDVRVKLETENTAEAIATGVIVSLLAQAHMERLE